MTECLWELVIGTKFGGDFHFLFLISGIGVKRDVGDLYELNFFFIFNIGVEDSV